MIETSIDIICTLDVEGAFIRVSENCLPDVGLAARGLPGRPWFDFIHARRSGLAIRNYRLRTEGKFRPRLRKRHVRPDGTIVPCSGR